MSEARDPFEIAVLPVASPEDARTTCAGAAAHLRRTGGQAVVVHVIEGTPPTDDGHPEHADETFAAAREAFDAANIDIETRLEYGEEIPETVFAVADEIDASAIAFTPRAGGRWLKLLSGDLTNALVTESDRPVVVLPERYE